jgi:hypothetical protein
MLIHKINTEYTYMLRDDTGTPEASNVHFYSPAS